MKTRSVFSKTWKFGREAFAARVLSPAEIELRSEEEDFTPLEAVGRIDELEGKLYLDGSACC